MILMIQASQNNVRIMSEFISILERIRPGYGDGGRIGFKKGTPFPFTSETLKEIDNLIKTTNLSLKDIGKKIGFGTGKRSLTIDAPVMKKYLETYGKPKPGRLKPANLAKDPAYVESVIDKVKELGSKKAAAKELKIDRKTINNILKQKAPELMKSANIDKGGKYNYQKVRAKTIKEMEKVLKKMPGGKETLNQTVGLMDKINDQNKIILKMSDKEILSNKKLIDSMKLDVTELKTSNPRLNFNRYNNLSDKQLVNKIRDLAKTNEMVQVEHQIPISSKRTASLFPKNIQVAYGKVGGQLETLKNFVVNKPDSPVVKDIDKYLNSQTIQIKDAKGQNIGFKDDIVYKSKTGQSNIIKGLTTKPSMIKGAFKAAKPVLKAIPLVGTALGIYDVGKAVQAGITDPRDLFVAYQVSADVAAKNKLMREDPEFRQKELVGLPAIQTEDFTSFRNGGIVAVKGVK